MARLVDLMAAVELGQDCRRSAQINGRDFANPFIPDTEEGEAWQAGYDNDLHAWQSLFDAAQKLERPSRSGRLKAMDKVVFNAHTHWPDWGYFLGYDRDRPGYARVHLNRAGTTSVPKVALTRKPKQGVAA